MHCPEVRSFDDISGFVVITDLYSLCRDKQQDSLAIECDEAQHSVAPGQVAVLWDGDWCLGSGIIESAS